MLQRLIDDMNKALDNDCFFSALSLALILPDVCGKAKYPTEKNNKKDIPIGTTSMSVLMSNARVKRGKCLI